MCSSWRPFRPADTAARPYQSEVSAGDSLWRGLAGGRYGALETAQVKNLAPAVRVDAAPRLD